MRMLSRIFTFASVALLALGTTACSSNSTPITMPDLTNTNLQDALQELKDVGITIAPEVESTGLFGVLNEANWTVCKQSPPPHEVYEGEAPKLWVDRSCEDSEPRKANRSPLPKPQTSQTPEENPLTQEPPQAQTPEQPPILTVENSPEFAEFLSTKMEGAPLVESFASTHAGKEIEFDANIRHFIRKPDGLRILIDPGDYMEDSINGPSIVMNGVRLQRFELNEPVRIGQNIHIRATIKKYEKVSQLFVIEPLQIRER